VVVVVVVVVAASRPDDTRRASMRIALFAGVIFMIPMEDWGILDQN
jgi:hypothetical protein